MSASDIFAPVDITPSALGTASTAFGMRETGSFCDVRDVTEPGRGCAPEPLVVR